MLIKTPESVSREINKRLIDAVGEKVKEPHITLGRPFNSTKRDIRVKLESWLKMQSAFRIDLDTIGCFNTGLVYLTSSDQDQTDKLKDLFYGIKAETDGGLNENIGFCPHLTLVRRSCNPLKDIEILDRVFSRPIELEVRTISLFKGSNGSKNWQNLGNFNISNCGEEYRYTG